MYCFPDDVLEELYLPLRKQLTEHFDTEDELQQFLYIHIKRASTYVDTFLNQHYIVPVSVPIPATLVTITAKLASYYAVANFSELEDSAKDKRDTAQAMLYQILKAKSFTGLTRKSSSQLQGVSDPRVYPESKTRGW